jgi:hypothetical protein
MAAKIAARSAKANIVPTLHGSFNVARVAAGGQCSNMEQKKSAIGVHATTPLGDMQARWNTSFFMFSPPLSL